MKKRASSVDEKPKRRPKSPHGVRGGSPEANRQAIVILEVLAGARTPAEAAQALEVSLPRYYQLETRALEGLVAACEPRPKGKRPSPETRLAELERELDRARRECARQQALVRAAGRALGVKAAASARERNGSARKTKGRAAKKRRRATPRALKAVAALREKDRQATPEAVQPTEEEASPAEATRQA